MIVMKFGGTSVGTGERIANVAQITADILTRSETPPVVIVSAMNGVTDSLARAAQTAAAGNGKTFSLIREELQQRHEQAIEDAGIVPELARGVRAEVTGLLDWFENLCHSIHTLGELTPRGLDAVSGLGERISARITSAAMISRGLQAQTVEATELIVTTADFGNAKPLYEQTTGRAQGRLLPLLRAGVVPVVTGFIGATVEGVPTTLGRGGSDYTATILGRCLGADEVWIWTDVDGVMTADPRVVPGARTLPHISYGEAAELSFFGAKVLHPRTIEPVAERNIPIRVLNSLNPQRPPTLISGTVTATPLVKGITAIRNVTLITVEGRGMQGVPGVAARLFTAVAGSRASVLLITQSSSEQSICFVIQTMDAPAVLDQLHHAFELELIHHDIDHIARDDEVAIVAVVGAGMRGTPGIAAQVFSALAEQGINIISIAQGSSEYNLSLIVAHKDSDEAVRVIHQKFGLDKLSPQETA